MVMTDMQVTERYIASTIVILQKNSKFDYFGKTYYQDLKSNMTYFNEQNAITLEATR